MANITTTCIIPVRNGERTIIRAIESALDAGCDKVLVFDDGSTDKTDFLLETVRQSMPHQLKVFSLGQTVRCGVVFARNFLIDEADDGLIIPLDCDDTLEPIEPFVNAYTMNTWVYGAYIQHQNTAISRIDGAMAGALPRLNITGVTFLFHKNDWRNVGGYDPDFAYAEDYAFQCALTNAGVNPLYVNEVLYTRYLYDGSNERTAKAGLYWNFYRDMARSKYQNMFKGTN